MAVSDHLARTTAVFDDLESEVRSYCRSWPAVFDTAVGSWLRDVDGNAYLDFFSGAGTLNYGHNDARLRAALIEYLLGDHVVHSLDTFTAAKRDFLLALHEVVLRPRGLDYRVQFPGPAGTNAVEAALKLARKVTGRTDVVCFSNAFHGASLGALAVGANLAMRRAAGVPLEHAIRLPFDTGTPGEAPDFSLLEAVLHTRGRARPAAVILETVQGEGGINVASPAWLRGVAERCRRTDVLLIVDDIQMGCGRTGPFFSFEVAGIEPDVVCLSKAISGYGMPMALTLIRPELDVWRPGEHNGTFRGFNPAFVTGAAALRAFWQDDTLQRATLAKGERVGLALEEIVRSARPGELVARGRGLAWGLRFECGEDAGRVAAEAFERGLLVERAGPRDEVVKLLPPLTISPDELDHGLGILADAVAAAC